MMKPLKAELQGIHLAVSVAYCLLLFRMTENRKQRHLSAIEGADKKFRQIHDLLEPRVAEASVDVSARLNANEELMERLFDILSDECLINLEQVVCSS